MIMLAENSNFEPQIIQYHSSMENISNFNFNGKKAIIRVDFNVPLSNTFEITDTTRIDAAIPTIQKILDDGGAVILMSHLGRPKDGPEEKYSLKHLLPYLNKELQLQVKFADDCIGENAKALASGLKPGEVLLLENLRFYKEETKGNSEFAEKLAHLADVYVNDAFGTAHRAHASTAVIAGYFPEKKMFGYIMENEVMSLNRVLKHPEKPFTAIIGGAKVSGKLEVIQNLLDKVDYMIIGGGMMFTFIKALGGNIGNSLVEDELIDTANEIIELAREKGVTFYFPKDAIAASEFSNDANTETTNSYNIPENWMGLDIGPESCKLFTDIVMQSKTILWNGPMGVFELPKFEQGTKCIALAVANATQNGAYSLIGGGDSVAAINKLGLANEVSYVSTGGGAMLEYVEGKILPGVSAIAGQ